jgi:hypothetical protein
MGRSVKWNRAHQRDKRSAVAEKRAAEAERSARQPQKLTKAEMRAMIEAAMRKRSETAE